MIESRNAVRLSKAVSTCLAALLAVSTASGTSLLAEDEPQQSTPATTGSRPALQVNPAPTNFFERWQARATHIQSQQPKWMVPASLGVSHAYPGLSRGLHPSDLSDRRPYLESRCTSRGLNLIPFNRTEFDVLLPPYL